MATSDAPLNVPNVTLAVARVTSPPSSGGGGALEYVAPTGIADGRTITLTTDSSEGWDFGSETKVNSALGFGQGYLYENAAGTNLPVDFTDPLYSKSWKRIADTEDLISRQIASDLGVKWVYSPPNSDGVLNGGYFYFDYGSLIPPETPILVSCINKSEFLATDWSRDFFEIQNVDSDTQLTLTSPFTVGEHSNVKAVVTTDLERESGKVAEGLRINTELNSAIITSAEASNWLSTLSAGQFIGIQENTQWKHVRFQRLLPNGANENEIYIKKKQSGLSGYAENDGDVIVKRVGAGDLSRGGGAAPMIYDKPQRIDYLVNPGALDGSGTVKTRSIVPFEGTGIIQGQNLAPSDNIALYDSASSERWQLIVWQDFVDYANGGQSWTTDFFVQIGSYARFELADAETPELTTESYILPHKSWSASQVDLQLWKGLFSNYTGKFVHFYDDAGNFKKAVAL